MPRTVPWIVASEKKIRSPALRSCRTKGRLFALPSALLHHQHADPPESPRIAAKEPELHLAGTFYGLSANTMALIASDCG